MERESSSTPGGLAKDTLRSSAVGSLPRDRSRSDRRRERRRGGGGLRIGLGLALALVALGVARWAHADPQSWDDKERAAREARLVAPLRAKDAEAARLFEEASAAFHGGDCAKAEPLFKKVGERQPSFAPALRRRGACAVEQGRHAEGIALAREAVKLDPSVDNSNSLGFLLLQGQGDQTASFGALNEAHQLAKANLERIPDDVSANQLWCQSALLLKWADDLQRCAEHFVRNVPKSASAHLFASLAALSRGDFGEARAAHEQARALGLPPEQDARLSSLLDENEPLWSRYALAALGLVAGWLLGLVLLLLLGGLLSRATLRMVRSLPKDEAQPQGQSLRTLYRTVLHISCVYYYLSLPLILLGVLALGGGVILLCLYIGRIPIKLVLLVGALVLFTIVAVLKSLFVRVPDGEPGQPLDLSQHPRLAKLLEEVAERVGTRPVDRVYMTPDADIAVLERGGLGKQIKGGTERCLVLGAAVLEGMQLGQLRAILAHEYGHFASRDTAGGGFALAVRRSLLMTAVRLAESGAAGWYNPAWWFISGFHRIFLRISHGASRLQEVMADRRAAFSYGAEAFASGLRHVIRRAIVFDAHVGATLKEVVEQARPLANLYEYTPTERPADEEIEQSVKDALTREPSPYDSHPRPADRIAWVLELVVTAPSREDDALEAWSLFADKGALQRQLTSEIRSAVAMNHGVLIAETTEAAEAAETAKTEDAASPPAA